MMKYSTTALSFFAYLPPFNEPSLLLVGYFHLVRLLRDGNDAPLYRNGAMGIVVTSPQKVRLPSETCGSSPPYTAIH